MKVMVLKGGFSTEREVSLVSGSAVEAALQEAGLETSSFELDPVSGKDTGALIASPELRDCDVVFIVLHGGEGEDGRIQAVLDLVGKPYTGSGVRASSLCMDKVVTKIIFEYFRIATPPWALVGPGDSEPEEHLEALGGLPIVVKPVNQGSSIGISIVESPEALAPAIVLARRYSEDVIFERYIRGRELSVAVIGGRAFPVIEIRPKQGFYDYDRKYTKGLTRYECPARLDGDLSESIRTDALKAYNLLGCESFSRVDLRLCTEGRPYFLEVNTIPGMTPTSLVPMAADAEGISFPSLCSRICKQAMEKATNRNAKTGG
jgi:D-alanine-D-alanine ligase